MTQDAIDVENALHMLDFVVHVLQATAVLTLLWVVYAVWRWHRSRWK